MYASFRALEETDRWYSYYITRNGGMSPGGSGTSVLYLMSMTTGRTISCGLRGISRLQALAEMKEILTKIDESRAEIIQVIGGN